MAATGIDLPTLAAFYCVPVGTLGRWAHEQSWPVVRKRSQRFGTPTLYDFDVVSRLAGDRLEQRKRTAEAA